MILSISISKGEKEARVVDFNATLEQLATWSLFELNRLQTVINQKLNDPERNEVIKRQLSVGMKISYFCCDKNDLVEATIEHIKKTWVSVINTHDSRRWNIKFCLINLQNIDTLITHQRNTSGVDKTALRVGDYVGWHSKFGHDVYGVIEKLNPKKALVRLGNSEIWRVPYSLLFPVMEGATADLSAPLCIEGEIVNE